MSSNKRYLEFPWGDWAGHCTSPVLRGLFQDMFGRQGAKRNSEAAAESAYRVDGVLRVAPVEAAAAATAETATSSGAMEDPACACMMPHSAASAITPAMYW